MRQISDNIIIFILVLIIAISIVGTVFNLNIIKTKSADSQITGKATQGNVQLFVEAFVNINVPNTEINFGSGSINQTTDLATEQVNPGTFNPCIEQGGEYNHSFECRGIQIENVGNTYVSLSFNSSQDGDGLLLGNNATDEFRFAVLEGNLSRNFTDSCKINGNTGESLFPKGSSYLTGFINWTAVNKSFIYTICHNFSFWQGQRSLVFEVNLTVPADESSYNPGQERTATLSFIAESVDG